MIKKLTYSENPLSKNAWKMLLIPLFCLCTTANHAQTTMFIEAPESEAITLDIDPETSFTEVMAQIATLVDAEHNIENEEQEFNLTFSKELGMVTIHMKHNSSSSSSRDYYQHASDSEKSDLRYLLKNLATASWMKLLDIQTSLKRAGERVDHIHPLRFLLTIFKDEELKTYIHNIHARGKVWKEFSSTLFENLDKEASRDNLKSEYISDFATHLQLDPSLLQASLQKQNWDNLINLLFEQVPRSGDYGRYDMTLNFLND